MVTGFRAALEVKIGIVSVPDKSGFATDRTFEILGLGRSSLCSRGELTITVSASVFLVSMFIMTVEIKVVREATRADDFFKSILMQNYA